MLVTIIVDVGDDVEHSIRLSVDPRVPVLTVIAQLRSRCNIHTDLSISVRNRNGVPILLTSTVESIGLHTVLYVLVDGDARHIDAIDFERIEPPATDDPTRHQVRYSASETRLGPELNFATLMQQDDSDTTDDELSMLKGLHSIKVNGVYEKSYSRTDVPCGVLILKERPYVTVMYPMQIVELVKEEEKLRTRQGDPDMRLVTSSLHGVPDDEFTRLLSIGMAYGTVVNTMDRYEKQIAFFPELTCIRHSCSPNAIVTRSLSRQPFKATCRCCVFKGIAGGEEVTALLPGCDTVGFMLLSADRRKALIKKKYHFECECARCWKSQSSEWEVAMTGAMFHPEARADPELQRTLTTTMRQAFDGLHLLDQDGWPIPTKKAVGSRAAIAALLAFISTYSAQEGLLRLNTHHWRLCLARSAFLAEVFQFIHNETTSERASRSGSGVAASIASVLTKDAFEVAFAQLESEGIFVPTGHPFSLFSHRAFQQMVSQLPANLAKVVQRRALKLKVDWRVFSEVEKIWAPSR
jgi:hypothetical protein